jgi:hypothetical protein
MSNLACGVGLGARPGSAYRTDRLPYDQFNLGRGEPSPGAEVFQSLNQLEV